MSLQSIKKMFQSKGMAVVICFFILIAFSACFILTKAMAQTTEAARLSPEAVKAASTAYLAAAISVGAGSIAAAIALAYIGAAAMGAISEKPEIFGKALIFAGLAEGVAVYGLIIAIMILSRV